VGLDRRVGEEEDGRMVENAIRVVGARRVDVREARGGRKAVALPARLNRRMDDMASAAPSPAPVPLLFMFVCFVWFCLFLFVLSVFSIGSVWVWRIGFSYVSVWICGGFVEDLWICTTQLSQLTV